MRRVLYLSLFVLACAVPAFAQDPVKVDPDHYKAAINNGQVRVLMIHYGPHEKSKMHWHPNGVAIPQTSGKVRFYLPGGKHTDMDMVAGQPIWTPAGAHNPENLSDSEDSENYINYYPDDGSNDPYTKFESNELTRLLADAVEELPEKERLVLSLYYYEEFTMKEIGALLGVNESRVSQLHTKATLRLRGRLAKLVPDVDSMLRTSVTG